MRSALRRINVSLMNLSAIRAYCASPKPPTGISLPPTMTPTSIYQHTATPRRHRAHQTRIVSCMEHYCTFCLPSDFTAFPATSSCNCCSAVLQGACQFTRSLLLNTRFVLEPLLFGEAPPESSRRTPLNGERAHTIITNHPHLVAKAAQLKHYLITPCKRLCIPPCKYTINEDLARCRENRM